MRWKAEVADAAANSMLNGSACHCTKSTGCCAAAAALHPPQSLHIIKCLTCDDRWWTNWLLLGCSWARDWCPRMFSATKHHYACTHLDLLSFLWMTHLHGSQVELPTLLANWHLHLVDNFFLVPLHCQAGLHLKVSSSNFLSTSGHWQGCQWSEFTLAVHPMILKWVNEYISFGPLRSHFLRKRQWDNQQLIDRTELLLLAQMKILPHMTCRRQFFTCRETGFSIVGDNFNVLSVASFDSQG